MPSLEETLRLSARTMRSRLNASAKQFRNGKTLPTRAKTVWIPNKRNASKSFDVIERKLAGSVSARVMKRRGQADRIRLDFAYHGFFVERGIGPGNRTPKVWFNRVMTDEVSKLADQVNETYADSTVRSILL